jgi:hypothetical protein
MRSLRRCIGISNPSANQVEPIGLVLGFRAFTRRVELRSWEAPLLPSSAQIHPYGRAITSKDLHGGASRICLAE